MAEERNWMSSNWLNPAKDTVHLAGHAQGSPDIGEEVAIA